MDNRKRFDQLESLLVDIARRQDQQAEQITQIIEVLNRQGEAIARQGEAVARQEVRLDNISEQIGDIINIFKLSEARHTEAERRQDELMAEMQQQSKRQDIAVEALKALFKHQQATDSRLDELVQTELQMLQLMRRDAEKLEDHEPRIKRLEDELLRPAG